MNEKLHTGQYLHRSPTSNDDIQQRNDGRCISIFCDEGGQPSRSEAKIDHRWSDMSVARLVFPSTGIQESSAHVFVSYT